MATLPCSGLTNLFYSDADHDQAAATALCRTCPHVSACLARALGDRYQYGVAGAMAAHERRAVIVELRRRARTIDAQPGSGSRSGR